MLDHAFVGCTVKTLPNEQWVEAAANAVRLNPANRPAEHMLSQATGAVLPVEHLALVTGKYWGASGVHLTVAFLDTSDSQLKARILSHMNAWGMWCNASFSEVATNAQVRIARSAGGGYWSYLGTDILSIDAGAATMNLDSFSMNTAESEYHRVVRHETGHTMGFPHEHLRKEIVNRIDAAKAKAYFLANDGWDATTTQNQVLTPLGDATLTEAPTDADSIMCYFLPGTIMTDGVAVAGGTDIDAEDALFADTIYPTQATSPTALDVFWIGPDGGVGTTWANPAVDNAAWHAPFPIAPASAARADSPVAAITRLNGGLDVFWIGPDGGVGTTWANPAVDSGNWHSPFPIAPANAAGPDSPIAAVTRLNGGLDAFWIGPDGGVGTTWAPAGNTGSWHAPFPIAPANAARVDSPIAAVTRLNGGLDVFWIGPDGGVGTTWANPAVDGGNWHTPFPIAPANAARADSPIAAVTRLNGALDVFWIGPDGGVGTTWANPAVDGGNWHAPFPIAPANAARADSPIAAVTRLNGALDVFWVGPDGGVGVTWANPAVDGGSWHTPFPIAPANAARVDSPLAAVTR